MEGVSEPSKTPARPPQVTVAAWMIMVGSVFVVLMVWDRIAGLHSLDTRKALEPLLARPADQGAGHPDRRPAGRDPGRLDDRGRLRDRDGGPRLPDPPAQPRRTAGADGARRAAVHRRPGDRRLRLVGRRRRGRDAVAGPGPDLVRRERRVRRTQHGPRHPPGDPARLAAAVRPRSAGTAPGRPQPRHSRRRSPRADRSDLAPAAWTPPPTSRYGEPAAAAAARTAGRRSSGPASSPGSSPRSPRSCSSPRSWSWPRTPA